jgi:hypothetical protein
MDSFDAIVFVWAASAIVVTVIGYLRGRTEDAMTLGIFLGPLGVILAILLLRDNRSLRDEPRLLQARDAVHARHVAVSTEARLRHAA